jgi:hypothetical protein
MQLTAYKLLYQDLDENIQTVEIKSNPPALNKEKNPEKEKSR